MSDTFPYVQSPSKFRDFLDKIKGIGVPNEFGSKELKALGYTSSHDQKFLTALRFIGLIEGRKGGTPTELWKLMRSDQPAAIAQGTRQGYSNLFAQYPDAHQRDEEALTAFFAAHSTAAADTVRRMVSTFKVFAEVGNFSDLTQTNLQTDNEVRREPGAARSNGRETADVHRVVNANSTGMTVNINVQLQVPPDTTGEVYEKFFEAMRKSLLEQNDA
ncbi:MAG: DUF5343 domain-containing protein [Parvularcula sp.]|jgi:hypothetical protein|nr:DUF5343 domain-containing protein [Parvularcula sp.]